MLGEVKTPLRRQPVELLSQRLAGNSRNEICFVLVRVLRLEFLLFRGRGGNRGRNWQRCASSQTHSTAPMPESNRFSGPSHELKPTCWSQRRNPVGSRSPLAANKPPPFRRAGGSCPQRPRSHQDVAFNRTSLCLRAAATGTGSRSAAQSPLCFSRDRDYTKKLAHPHRIHAGKKLAE